MPDAINAESNVIHADFRTKQEIAIKITSTLLFMNAEVVLFKMDYECGGKRLGPDFLTFPIT